MSEDRKVGPEGAADDKGLPPGKERALIRHLPFFVTLAQEGHFARAAALLAMSQSALTRRIQSLETELGVKLFARSRRSVRLTEAGAAFYEDTDRILQDMRHSIRRAQKVMRGEAGSLSIGVNDGAIQFDVLARTFREFRGLYPDLDIRLHSMISEAQMQALRNDEIDLGVLYDIVVDKAARRQLELMPIYCVPFMLVMNETHPLATRKRIRAADLEGEWQSWFSGRPFSDAIMAAHRAAGVVPHIALEISNEATAINMALANLAVGFVRSTARLPAGVVLRKVEDIDVSITAHAVWMRQNQNPALRSFVRVLRDRLGEAAAA